MRRTTSIFGRGAKTPTSARRSSTPVTKSANIPQSPAAAKATLHDSIPSTPPKYGGATHEADTTTPLHTPPRAPATPLGTPGSETGLDMTPPITPPRPTNARGFSQLLSESPLGKAISRHLLNTMYPHSEVCEQWLEAEFSPKNKKGGKKQKDQQAVTPETIHAAVTLRLKQAIDCCYSRDFDGALSLLKPLCAVAATHCPWDVHARVLVHYGWALSASSRSEEAIVPLQEALSMFETMNYGSSTVALRVVLSSAFRDAQRPVDAEHQLRAALGLIEGGKASDKKQFTLGHTPQSSLDEHAVFSAYGTFLWGQHRLEEARRMFDRAADCGTTASKQQLANTSLARVLKAMGENHLAAEAYAKAVNLLPAVPFGKDGTAQTESPRRRRSRARGGKAVRASTPEPEETSNAASLADPAVAARDVSPSKLPAATQLDSEFLRFEAASHQHHELQNTVAAMQLYEAAIETQQRHLDALRESSSAAEDIQSTGPKAPLRSAREMHGKILFNAALCAEKLGPDHAASAVGLLQAAIDVFVENGQSAITARIRLHHARLLANNNAIDRAVEEYTAALEIVTSEATHAVPQLAGNNKRAPLHEGEVRAHFGHCLHFRVGDFEGAQLQYSQALKHSQALSVQTLCFVLDSYAALHMKWEQYGEAVELLTRRIFSGDLVGDPSVAAKLQLTIAYEVLQEHERARLLLEGLLLLPDNAISITQQFDAVCRYAYLAHYHLRDYPRAVELYELAMKLDDCNPHLIVQAAWCIGQLPDADLDKMERLYDRAVRVLAATMTHSERQWKQQILQLTETLQGDAAAAVEEPAPIPNQQPLVFDELYVLGEVACFYHDRKKDINRAEEFYRAALGGIRARQSESFGQACANFAILLCYNKRDIAGAEHQFAEALKDAPYNVNVNVLYTDFLVHINAFDRALEHLAKMVQLFPEEGPNVYHRMARIEDRAATTWSLDEAMLLYMKANGASPDITSWNDDAVVELMKTTTKEHAAGDLVALIQNKGKHFELAKRCFDVLLPRFPDSVALHINCALNCQQSDAHGGVAQAHEHFERAFEIDPSNPVAVDHLADFLSRIDPTSVTAAERLYLHCIDTHPNDPVPHFNYASFLANVSNHPEAAERHFRKAITLGHPDPLVFASYAAFLEAQLEQRGQYWTERETTLDSIEKLYDRAIEASPKAALLHVYRGTFLWKCKSMTEAWDAFQEALELEPSNPSALRSAATFLHDWHVLTTNGNAASGSQASGTDRRNTGAHNLKSGSGHDYGHGFTPLSSEQLTSAAKTAKELFTNAIKIDANDLPTLQNYARFLEDVQKDAKAASNMWDFVEKREAELEAQRQAAERSLRNSQQETNSGSHSPMASSVASPAEDIPSNAADDADKPKES